MGLDPVEADTYLAALKIGGGTVTELSRAGRIERTGIYYHIDRLIELGLLKTVNKGKRLVYLPADPNRLREILKEKEERLDNVLPSLSDLFVETNAKSASSYYQGKEGIIQLYEQLYNIALGYHGSNERYYIFGHSFDAVEALPDFFPEYVAKRSKLPIKAKIILPTSEKPRKTIDSDTKDPKVIAKYSLHIMDRKYIAEKYSYKGTVIIIGKYAATIDFKNFYGSLTENANLAGTWKMFFRFIWDHLK